MIQDNSSKQNIRNLLQKSSQEYRDVINMEESEAQLVRLRASTSLGSVILMIHKYHLDLLNEDKLKEQLSQVVKIQRELLQKDFRSSEITNNLDNIRVYYLRLYTEEFYRYYKILGDELVALSALEQDKGKKIAFVSEAIFAYIQARKLDVEYKLFGETVLFNIIKQLLDELFAQEPLNGSFQ